MSPHIPFSLHLTPATSLSLKVKATRKSKNFEMIQDIRQSRWRAQLKSHMNGHFHECFSKVVRKREGQYFKDS